MYAHMLQQGWDRRPGVRILFGRWQDVLPGSGLRFDGVFWDTFSECYEDMQCALSHTCPAMLLLVAPLS